MLNHTSYFVAGLAIETWCRQCGRVEGRFSSAQAKGLEVLVLALFLSNAVQGFQILPLEVLAPLIVLLSGASSSFLHPLLSHRVSIEIGRASYEI